MLHNASIINAVAATGLEIYKFGRTISVPFFEEKWRPASFLMKTVDNFKLGMHTLLLMDIKTHELDWKLYLKGVERFQNPRYMSCAVCCQQILQVFNEKCEEFEETQQKCIQNHFDENVRVVACMRVGTDSQRFICCSIKEMATLDTEMGAPLHSLVVLGNEVSDMEEEMLKLWIMK